MLCARVSLFMNVTRVPGEIVICAALRPADVIVMVTVGVGEGDDGDPPPHAASGRMTRTRHNLRTLDYRTRLRSRPSAELRRASPPPAPHPPPRRPTLMVALTAPFEASSGAGYPR